MIELRDPKEVSIKIGEGEERVFLISKLPAIVGREIVSQYPTSGMPKVGDYSLNQSLMLKSMAFVEAEIGEGRPNIRLTTKGLVDNHVPDWESLARLEWEMLVYNCSFLADGKASSFLEDLVAKLPGLITSMLTDSLEQSSQKIKPASTS